MTNYSDILNIDNAVVENVWLSLQLPHDIQRPTWAMVKPTQKLVAISFMSHSNLIVAMPLFILGKKNRKRFFSYWTRQLCNQREVVKIFAAVCQTKPCFFSYMLPALLFFRAIFSETLIQSRSIAFLPLLKASACFACLENYGRQQAELMKMVRHLGLYGAISCEKTDTRVSLLITSKDSKNVTSKTVPPSLIWYSLNLLLLTTVWLQLVAGFLQYPFVILFCICIKISATHITVAGSCYICSGTESSMVSTGV